MPRSVQEDYLQNFRFRVFEVAGGADVFKNEEPVAGFNNITMPGVTLEVGEHRTGKDQWTKKQPGVPTVEDCTMTRGVLLGDTTFYDWMKKYFERKPFRTDLQVRQYNQEGNGFDPNDKFAREMTLRNCFPTSIKLMGDLDATASDVNIQEITCSVEWPELEAPATI